MSSRVGFETSAPANDGGMGKKLKIALVVLAYFIVSICLVFFNKILLTKPKALPDGEFEDPNDVSRSTVIPAPLFVTWFQCVLTAIIVYVLGMFGEGSTSSIMKELPNKRLEYSFPIARSVLPLSAIFVAMITFNNLCLKYVEVSFYNVARSLSIVFNVIFTYCMLGEKTSTKTLGALLIVIFGFFIGSDGELNFSLLGTTFGVISSIFVCLNAIYTSKVMPSAGIDKDKWKLAFYNNVNASIMFFPLMFITGEHNIILAHWHLLSSSWYWFLMFSAGVLGFLIGIVTVMQIQHTSPLTHNISGTAKACVQTILAYFIWKNESTLKGNIGVFCVIVGGAVYAYVRMEEMDAAAAAKKAAYMPVSTSSQSPESIELKAQQKV